MEGKTALEIFGVENNMAECMACIQQHSEKIKAFNYTQSDNILLLALVKQNTKVCLQLLKILGPEIIQACVTVTDKERRTPLMIAVQYQAKEVCLKLIELT